MKIATVRLKGFGDSPYSQSRKYEVERFDQESHDDYEQRTWRERMHVDKDGEVFIPPMALKLALTDAAKFHARRIPGRGQNTYGKHFEAGILIVDPVRLGIRKEDVPCDKLFLNADGKKGGGTRVRRFMPRIENWSGTATFYVLDDTITEAVFEDYLRRAGKFIGIGRFRPRSGGFYGRFDVEAIEWRSERDDAARAAA